MNISSKSITAFTASATFFAEKSSFHFFQVGNKKSKRMNDSCSLPSEIYRQVLHITPGRMWRCKDGAHVLTYVCTHRLAKRATYKRKEKWNIVRLCFSSNPDFPFLGDGNFLCKRRVFNSPKFFQRIVSRDVVVMIMIMTSGDGCSGLRLLLCANLRTWSGPRQYYLKTYFNFSDPYLPVCFLRRTSAELYFLSPLELLQKQKWWHLLYQENIKAMTENN